MAKAKKERKSGPRGKYQAWLTREGLIKLEGWARDGLTNEQIAQNIRINPDTLYTWIKKYPEISESLKRGKEVVDRQVENALFKSAVGYDFEEQTFETVTFYRTETQEIDGEVIVTKIPETKEVMTKRVTKQVAPNPTSAIFWLKNRKPKEWRDKTEVQVTQTKSEAVDEMQEYLKNRREADGSN